MKLYVLLYALAESKIGERAPDERSPGPRLTPGEREVNQRGPPRERTGYNERAETYDSRSHCGERQSCKN